MISTRYLAALALGTALWCTLYFAITLAVDPFGVSPLGLQIPKFNKFKPRRVDIDRSIKPYEVWRNQPKTVFLGTSRIHQSIDPAVFDGTRFAPAYNASIPASSLGLNISHLQQYLELDPKLRTVVVELFLYNFLGQGQEHLPKDFSEYLRNSMGLFVSADTLSAAILTVGYNLARNRPAYEIKPRGYFYYPPGHAAKGLFDGFPAGIWKLHVTRASGMQLHEPAFEAVRTLIELCRKRNIELIFVLTPNHAYDDYYLETIGAWETVRTWLTRLSAEGAAIYSFSQANAWVYEPVAEHMRYWNDPYHFSLEMGRGIQQSLAGTQAEGVPENFMMRLTPEAIPAHIEQRRAALRLWAEVNPGFVADLQEEKRRFENPEPGFQGDRMAATLRGLAELHAQVVKAYPASSIRQYRVVSDELVAAKVLPASQLRGARIQNAWGGRVVVQVFPPNAWGPGTPATYNYVLDAVPGQDCSRLVAGLAGQGARKVLRINVEPSARVHSRFPVSGDDGCGAGANSVGYTVHAE